MQLQELRVTDRVPGEVTVLKHASQAQHELLMSIKRGEWLNCRELPGFLPVSGASQRGMESQEPMGKVAWGKCANR